MFQNVIELGKSECSNTLPSILEDIYRRNIEKKAMKEVTMEKAMKEVKKERLIGRRKIIMRMSKIPFT